MALKELRVKIISLQIHVDLDGCTVLWEGRNKKHNAITMYLPDEDSDQIDFNQNMTGRPKWDRWDTLK